MRHRVWGYVALFCWAIALLSAIAPVRADNFDCGRAVRAAFSHDDGCAYVGARRVSGIVVWLLLSAPPAVRYLAGPRRPPAE